MKHRLYKRFLSCFLCVCLIMNSSLPAAAVQSDRGSTTETPQTEPRWEAFEDVPVGDPVGDGTSLLRETDRRRCRRPLRRDRLWMKQRPIPPKDSRRRCRSLLIRTRRICCRERPPMRRLLASRAGSFPKRFRWQPDSQLFWNWKGCPYILIDTRRNFGESDLVI